MGIRLRRAIVAAALASLALVGCANGGQVGQPSARDFPSASRTAGDADCGTGAFLTWVPGGGEPSRQAVLEGMLAGHRALRETPGAVQERSTPEDVILTLEAALRMLPELEASATPEQLVIVPAVDERGIELGQFVIEWDGKSYIITEYSIGHVAGVPCPES